MPAGGPHRRLGVLRNRDSKGHDGSKPRRATHQRSWIVAKLRKTPLSPPSAGLRLVHLQGSFERLDDLLVQLLQMGLRHRVAVLNRQRRLDSPIDLPQVLSRQGAGVGRRFASNPK